MAGGAVLVDAALAVLALLAALAYLGIGRGIGDTAGLVPGGGVENAEGLSVPACCPESAAGAPFFSLGTISAMLSLRT